MTVAYRHYDPSLIEPVLPQRTRELEDLAVELASQAGNLTRGLHPIVVGSIGSFVRSMNCYYSNLIEGHRTTPKDIERALATDFSDNPAQRDLQLEAIAHIQVQRSLDLDPHWQSISVVSPQFITTIHREFYQKLPDVFWHLEGMNVVPGSLRTTNVVIGRHISPPPDTLSSFLARFEKVYNPDRLSNIDRLLAAAASHHRLLWIHPFLDGNGRVARLFSHAYLGRIGVGSSLWSVSRGLARRVQQYRSLLDGADQQRYNDYDGRGNLTMAGLIAFCEFFLDTCLDQVRFMAQLLEPRQLLSRIETYVAHEIRQHRLSNGSFPLLKAAFLQGSFRRGEAAALTGYKERQARSVLRRLIEAGLLVSDSPKAPVRLGFPFAATEFWFPRLWVEL
jgi:Fic family protein